MSPTLSQRILSRWLNAACSADANASAACAMRLTALREFELDRFGGSLDSRPPPGGRRARPAAAHGSFHTHAPAHAARSARQFPAIFPALSDGRLHLSAVVLLVPYLSPDTADGLLAAATHKPKAQIELLLAERFPKPDLQELVRAIAAPSSAATLAVRPVVPANVSNAPACMAPLVPEPVVPSVVPKVPLHMEPIPSQAASRTKVAPSSPGRFTLQLTMGQVTHDLLREAQALLGHAVPSGDIEAVLQRALGEMVKQLRKEKYAECTFGPEFMSGKWVTAQRNAAQAQADPQAKKYAGTNAVAESKARADAEAAGGQRVSLGEPHSHRERMPVPALDALAG